MKISGIEAEVWRIPFEGTLAPAWLPGGTWREMTTTIFRVETDAGLVGIGAGYGSPTTVRERIAPRLTGEDPFAIERLGRIMRNAGGSEGHGIACAVELALWDIVGKAARLPLYQLWGAQTNKIKAYASLVEVRSPERRAEDARRLLDQGYRAVKLRLHSDTLEEDIAQVAAVREAVGDRMEIMVDANQAQEPGTPGSEHGLVWSYQRALATCRELAPLGVTWLEEPLGRYDFDHLARLSAESGLPIAGGENNVGLHEFRWLIDRDCYSILQPDALVSGGITQLRKIAAYAEMHHKALAPHHGGNGVGIAGHLHLCASLPNAPYLELLQEPPLLPPERFQGLITEPFLPDTEGFVHLPTGPGLGIELNDRWERVG